MTTHSDKALETIQQMNTTPEQWGLTPIRWVEEERMVPVEQCCPTCCGNRSLLLDENKTMIPWPALVKYPDHIEGDTPEILAQWEAAYAEYKTARDAREDYAKKVSAQRLAATGSRWNDNGNCPTCIKKKGYCTGRAMIPALRKVMIGYPEWLPGIRFDSRFGVMSTERYCCGLCSKTIKESNLVPVQAAGNDGKAHGMWVGEDCAMKIFRAELKKKKDHYLAVTPSQTAA